MKAKANSVLEKKLEELESLLEAITINDNDPDVYRRLELGVLFAKTLLAAEISSRPIELEGKEEVEYKLGCMATRLTEIEAFITNHSLIELENLETNERIGNGETGSVYSLVESFDLDESSKAEEEEKEEVVAEQCPLFQDASSEEMKEITFPAMVTVEEEVVVDREVKNTGRVGFKALVCFGLIGLVGGMIGLFGHISDNLMEDQYFSTPT